MCSLIRDIMAT